MDMKKTNKGSVKGRSPFTLRERSIIEVRWCRDTKTVTEIARELDLNKSAISRELDSKPRKGFGKYDADRARAAALERIGKRGNTQKLVRSSALREYAEEKLKLGWSPGQIEIRLPIEYPDDPSMRLSYETVCQHVYRQAHRGGNGKVKPGKEDLRRQNSVRYRYPSERKLFSESPTDLPSPYRIWINEPEKEDDLERGAHVSQQEQTI